MAAIDPNTLAGDLLNFWDTGKMLPFPPSSYDEGFTLDTAYAVEAEFRRLRTESGRTVTGRKVGYANKAMWRALKLNTLVWASMYDDTIHYGLKELSLDRLISPRIEPEIVFKLKRPILSGDLDAAGALDCVEWMALGFEIIDCPFPAWQFKPADFVAAFGLHRALIIGEPRDVDSSSIPSLVNELSTFKVKLLRDGQLVEEGSGRNSLRSPALCLAELAAAALRQNHSSPLEAGEIVSTGTLTGAQSIAPDETWKFETEALSLAGLEIRFSI